MDAHEEEVMDATQGEDLSADEKKWKLRYSAKVASCKGTGGGLVFPIII
jgi:hypothetical protein